MPFDIQVAIAELDCKSGDRPDLEDLRGRYPELGFIFDLVDNQHTELDETHVEHKNEIDDLEEDNGRYVQHLEERIDNLRAALVCVKELTVDAEILCTIEAVL